MSNVDKKRSWFALVVSHMCGMIDLAALPVWVGTLIAGFAMMEAEAGGLATLFLIGAVLCSLLLAPRFHRMNGRWYVPVAFAISATCFYAMTESSAYVAYAVLHFVAGAATGIAISFTHGSMGRSSNPHRVFAYGSLALGVAAVLYLGITPELIKQSGPNTLWLVFAGVMGFAAIVSALLFPSIEPAVEVDTKDQPKFTAQVWMVIAAIMLMALNNSMILSFAERVGDFRGFTGGQVQATLITMGFVALLPAILAAFFQSRVSAMTVGMVGALLHGLVCFGTMFGSEYTMYFAALIFVPFIMIFAHTFVFGHLSAIEPSGRAVAGTPAMVMTGSAVGPLLGGTIVQTMGYVQLGFLALGCAVAAAILFGLSTRVGSSAPIAAE